MWRCAEGKAFIASISNSSHWCNQGDAPTVEHQAASWQAGSRASHPCRASRTCSVTYAPIITRFSFDRRMLLLRAITNHLTLSWRKRKETGHGRTEYRSCCKPPTAANTGLCHKAKAVSNTLPPLPCRVDTFTSICGAPSGCGLPRPPPVYFFCYLLCLSSSCRQERQSVHVRASPFRKWRQEGPRSGCCCDCSRCWSLRR